MPISEIHKKKRLKNYVILAILLSVIAMFFTVTIIKLKAVSANVESTKK
jgi:hypothetical protein